MLIAAVRTPVMIVGIASGSSTLRITSNSVIPIAARRLDRARVDLAHADERVGEDRRDPEDDQRDRQVEDTDADERRP